MIGDNKDSKERAGLPSPVTQQLHGTDMAFDDFNFATVRSASPWADDDSDPEHAAVDEDEAIPAGQVSLTLHDVPEHRAEMRPSQVEMPRLTERTRLHLRRRARNLQQLPRARLVAHVGDSTVPLKVRHLNVHSTRRFAALYHLLLEHSLAAVMAGIAAVWMALVFVFALLYQAALSPYSLSFLETFTLSLEVQTRIGVPARADEKLGDKALLAVIMTFQALLALLTDALLFGIVFERARAGRCEFTKAAVVIPAVDAYSKKPHLASPRLQFRVVDLSRYPLLDAHVHVFLCCHRVTAEGLVDCFRTTPLRTNFSDRHLDATLLMSLPQTVTHILDRHSPILRLVADHLAESDPDEAGLRPRPFSSQHVGNLDDPGVDSPAVGAVSVVPRLPSAWLEQISDAKAATAETSDTDRSEHKNSVTTGAGEHTLDPSAMQRQPSEYPQRLREAGRLLDSPRSPQDYQRLRDAFQTHSIEIIGVVEGVEASTGALVQARVSYCFDDLRIGHRFRSSTFPDAHGGATLDLAKFHETHIIASDTSTQGSGSRIR
ncbi:MAG: hypothetical protein MHM6MM_004171 [Cercozoa sp. M6MM]